MWTPLNAQNAMKYPVMVFLHGGAFKWGYPAADVYDGNNIANHGEIVLVTVAYRIGRLHQTCNTLNILNTCPSRQNHRSFFKKKL
jgi:para-nitrobenzyl esterase